MTLLPKLEAEERDRIIREREDAERGARLSAAIAEMERHQREALELLEMLKKDLRFPLESVRVDSDA